MVFVVDKSYYYGLHNFILVNYVDLLASNNLGKPKNKVNCTPTLDCNLSNSHKTCKKRQRETLALVCTRLAVEPGTEKGGGGEGENGLSTLEENVSGMILTA